MFEKHLEKLGEGMLNLLYRLCEFTAYELCVWAERNPEILLTQPRLKLKCYGCRLSGLISFLLLQGGINLPFCM